MKHIRRYALIALALLALATATTAQAQLKDSVTLEWDYTAEFTEDVDTFVIYSSADVNAPKPWAVWAEIPAHGTDGTLVLFKTVPIQTNPGAQFFYATARNARGESDPSNVTRLPAAPARVTLRIRR